MREPIEVNYVPDGDDWAVTVSAQGRTASGQAHGLVAARDRADEMVAELVPKEPRTVVHLLNGDAVAFTSAYLTAQLEPAGATPAQAEPDAEPTDPRAESRPEAQESPEPDSLPEPDAKPWSGTRGTLQPEPADESTPRPGTGQAPEPAGESAPGRDTRPGARGADPTTTPESGPGPDAPPRAVPERRPDAPREQHTDAAPTPQSPGRGVS